MGHFPLVCRENFGQGQDGRTNTACVEKSCANDLPENRRGEVFNEKCRNGSNIDAKIVTNGVVLLITIFNEERVSANVVSDVVLDRKVIDAVHRQSAIEGVRDRDIFHITIGNRSDHVEVKWITA